MVRKTMDLLGYASVINLPRNDSLMPETKIITKKVWGHKTFICVKESPCKIVQVIVPRDTSKRQFVAIDIFTGKVFKATFPLSGICRVPVVTLTDYLLVDIDEKDSHVILLDSKDNIKKDLKLPTDEDLLAQIKFGFAEGKDVFVSVASAMGKEQIVDSKIRNPK